MRAQVHGGRRPYAEDTIGTYLGGRIKLFSGTRDDTNVAGDEQSMV